jgi:hypothetical protein
MQTSDAINEIAAALAKAQAEMSGAAKSSANPFFKSKYADLASVVDACRGALTANQIAVVQSPTTDGPRVSLETWLIHSSGQYLAGTVTAAAKDDSPQAVGSTITYLRRYALQSFAGVAPEDDDAETAQGRGTTRTQAAPVPPAPEGYAAWLGVLTGVAETGMEPLREAWLKSPEAFRNHLMTTNLAGWEGMKAAAQKKTDATAKKAGPKAMAS